MLLKLILILVIIATSYIVAVFQVPEVADSIWSIVGLEELNKKIRDGKDTYDTVVTDIPTKSELVDTYDQAFSWAVDIGNTIKWKIDLTKDKIDTVRSTLSGAEDTYNDLRGTIWEAKELIDTTTEKINEVKWTIEQVWEMTGKISEVTEIFASWSVSN